MKKIVKKPYEILDNMKEFYQDLYTSDKEIKFQYKNWTQTKIDYEEKLTLDCEISMDEVKKALKEMKRGKTLREYFITNKGFKARRFPTFVT